jgi:hypothetical protein
MPQGLQVWDAAGNLLVDTSTFVLKELVVATVNGSNTSNNYVATAIPANTTVIPSAFFMSSSSAVGTLPEVELETVNSRIRYRFESASGADVEIRSLAY